MNFWNFVLRPPRDTDHTYEKAREEIRQEFLQSVVSSRRREENLLEMERAARRTVLALLLSVPQGIRISEMTRALVSGPLEEWYILQHEDAQSGEQVWKAVRR